MMRFCWLIVFCLACTDSSTSDSIGAADMLPGLGVLDAAPAPVADAVPFIEPNNINQLDFQVDAAPSRCEDVGPGSEEYCSCEPQCCDLREWFCRPRSDGRIFRKVVVVGVCNRENVPCDYQNDQDCPPPSILLDGECELAFECPPSDTNDFIGWFECDNGDGTLGMQRIMCDKGTMIQSPCQPCVDESCDGLDNDCDERTDEGFFPCSNDCGDGVGICVNGEVEQCNANNPAEEICDGQDNDCDGTIDEGQTNVCGTCGPVPAEICDDVDNDCDGQTDEQMEQGCETACERGVEVCANGAWVGCTARPVAEEQCDGQDNDCDDSIDENLDCECQPEMVGALLPCLEPPLTCGLGFKTCECRDEPDCTILRMSDCRAACVYLPPEIIGEGECDPVLGTAINPEVCNNYDEDCDNLIDESLGRVCYTGPEGTLNVGVCTPGSQSCQEGRWGEQVREGGPWVVDHCLGEVLPSREVCDGADNDCDGVVDYGEEIKDTDILFVVDWSGSMADEINAVRMALNRFSSQFQAEEQLHWGLVIGPREHPRIGESLDMISDIVPFAQFLNSFAALGNEGMDTGSEMLRDAIYIAIRNISSVLNYDLAAANWDNHPGHRSSPDLQDFFINWRENTDKIIIVFTDEEDQTYLNPELDEEPLKQALRGTPNLKLYIFYSDFHPGRWADIALSGSGGLFDLTDNHVQMYEDLMSIIDEACLGPRAQQVEEVSAVVEHYDYVRRICE